MRELKDERFSDLLEECIEEEPSKRPLNFEDVLVELEPESDTSYKKHGDEDIRRARSCTRTAASRGTSQQERRLAGRKKRPAGGELTAAARRANRKQGRIRVRVEHALAGVKRRRLVRDVLRNKGEGTPDSVMEVAGGLHDVRVAKRRQRRKTSRRP